MPATRPRVLLLTPRYSYRIAAYLAAADTAGVELLIASDGEHSLIGALREGLQVDLGDPAGACRRLLDELPAIDGIVTTDDAVVELGARLAAGLGLPGNPPSAGRYTRRKDLARARLRDAGLPVPPFQCLRLDRLAAGALPALDFPLVLKPLALSASRGVIRVDDARQLATAAARVARITATARAPEERDWALLEGYLPGAEIALEGMLQGGRLQTIAVFDKPEPLTGPYFEESYYVTPSRQPAAVLARARALVQATCDAYGLRHGPVHAELRINDQGVWMLETAARTIGGQCALLVEYATGHSLETLVLGNALSRAPATDLRQGAAGVLMIPIPRAGVLRRVEGVLAAQQVPGIEAVELWLREGHELVPLPEGASYLGFVFATGPRPAAVEQSLREAHASLRIVTAPKWDIVAA